MIDFLGFIRIFMDIILEVCIIQHLLGNIDLFIDELEIIFFVECLPFPFFVSSSMILSKEDKSIPLSIREYA